MLKKKYILLIVIGLILIVSGLRYQWNSTVQVKSKEEQIKIVREMNIQQLEQDKSVEQILKQEWMSQFINDAKYFPVPISGKNPERFVNYCNSWGGSRTYGGNRTHEGTDLMADYNVSGYYPIVSICDGVVEKIGWLELGGYRLLIRCKSGAKFYYAHLSGYVEGIQEGTTIKAGQLIGYMGDTGYGEEGTKGKFAVHLHLGIYITYQGKEWSVNPYYLLQNLTILRAVY